MRRVLTFMAVVLSLTSPSAAGAWLQPDGHGLFIGEVSYSSADRRYGDPVGLSFEKLFAKTYSEYAVSARVTTFSAQEFVAAGIKDRGEETHARDTGFEIGGRIGLLTGDNRLSLQTSFRKDQDFTMTVSSGGGGLSGEVRLLYGTNFALRGLTGFLDVEAAWRWTSPPRPNEVVADVTFGMQPRPGTRVLLQSFNVFSAGYGGHPYTSYRSHKLEVSVVQRIFGGWSLQIGGIYSPGGDAVVAERGVKLAIWVNY